MIFLRSKKSLKELDAKSIDKFNVLLVTFRNASVTLQDKM